MPLTRPSTGAPYQNLLTSDGLYVTGLLNGVAINLLVRPTADTLSVPGEATVGLEVFVPGFGWRSTGFAGHKQ